MATQFSNQNAQTISYRKGGGLETDTMIQFLSLKKSSFIFS